jgi:hypothetical protein
VLAVLSKVAIIDNQTSKPGTLRTQKIRRMGHENLNQLIGAPSNLKVTGALHKR